MRIANVLRPRDSHSRDGTNLPVGKATVAAGGHFCIAPEWKHVGANRALAPHGGLHALLLSVCGKGTCCGGPMVPCGIGVNCRSCGGRAGEMGRTRAGLGRCCWFQRGGTVRSVI